MHRSVPAWPRAGSPRSPHARGCTNSANTARLMSAPFPACAGMHLRDHPRRRTLRPVPRMRGDAPPKSKAAPMPMSRSPHARGCTGEGYQLVSLRLPFPACAGMHRHHADEQRHGSPVPRMRGDAPSVRHASAWVAARSPHARGCTACRRRAADRRRPFPACAGMHRSRHPPRCRHWSVPRMRGDAPSVRFAALWGLIRSPHARGCTEIGDALGVTRQPFPACAGMHRPKSTLRRYRSAVPRMRGDAPSRASRLSQLSSRSPHARGCTA